MPLLYDNSAFYYFCLTMLAMYVLPASWYVGSYACRAIWPPKTQSTTSRTSVEKKKTTQLREERSPARLLCTASFCGHAVLLAVGWTVLLFLVYLVAADSDLERFDPYRILGIDIGAEDPVIRKAYRSLSLKYHPDKNPNNKVAEEMFMKVAKAYEALTDPVARENWEKHGNPDGKQALEVSIGLPTFLLDEGNHYAILFAYLGILVLVIPAIVAAWYAHSQKYGENNVMYETYSFFLHALSEHTAAKALPEVLAGAAESRQAMLSAAAKGGAAVDALRGGAERDELRDLQLRLKSHMPAKPRFEHPLVVRGSLLIHAHATRTPVISSTLRADTARLLKSSMRLCEAMLELSQSHRWLQTTVTIIDFMQYLTQALWTKDHPLQQLPHFTSKEVQHAVKGKHAVKSLRDYVRLPDDQKKGLAAMSDDQVRDVVTFCKNLVPDVEASFKLYVEDEAEIAERDLVTLLVDMDRRNVHEAADDAAGKGDDDKDASSASWKNPLAALVTRKNSTKTRSSKLLEAPVGRAPPVHAPFFPVPKLETWWVLVSDKQGQLILADKITSQAKRVKHRVKFVAPPQAGTYHFRVDLKSADYLGLDLAETVSMRVVPAATLPEYKPHQEDLELDDEPTLFEQVMSSNLEDSSDEEDDGGDEDDEDDDDDDDGPTSATKDAITAGSSSSTTKEGAAASSSKDGATDAKGASSSGVSGKKADGAASKDDDDDDTGGKLVAQPLTEAERRRRQAKLKRKTKAASAAKASAADKK
mmetsp:Transcript_27154/g.108744  ORF Transcript_27154/g.108744 Transcript_27154/m.108744 type:complete len:759 (-) Transcript_27154:2226-4502(-)